MSQYSKGHVVQKKIIFWYAALLHDFHIRQLSDYLITQFIEGRGHKGITIIKIFEFGNTKRNIKKCCSHREKGKQHVRLIIYTQTRGIFLLRLPLLLTLQMNQPFDVMFQL